AASRPPAHTSRRARRRLQLRRCRAQARHSGRRNRTDSGTRTHPSTRQPPPRRSPRHRVTQPRQRVSPVANAPAPPYRRRMAEVPRAAVTVWVNGIWSAPAALLVIAVITLAPAAAADRQPPRIVAAAMLDANGNFRADRLRLTYSEPIRHAADRDGATRSPS